MAALLLVPLFSGMLLGASVEGGAGLTAPPIPVQDAAPLPEDAALRLLSRFGPGELPAIDPIFEALQTLGEQGGADSLALLESLVAQEDPSLVAPAQLALDAVRARVQGERRAAFLAALPDDAALSAWRAARSDQLEAEPELGRRDQEALAYASLLLGEGEPGQPHTLELLDPDAAAAAFQAGAKAESEGHFVAALTLYAQAAASGLPQASEALAGLGVYHRKLLLGMTAHGGPMPASTLPVLAVDALLPDADRLVVATLLERSDRGTPLQRVVALEALAELVERGQMNAWERNAARRKLLDAAGDPRPAVRAAALYALADTGNAPR